MPSEKSANNIVFTSLADNAPAQWSGIQVQGGTAVLDHVEVRNGGGGGGFMCLIVQIPLYVLNRVVR